MLTFFIFMISGQDLQTVCWVEFPSFINTAFSAFLPPVHYFPHFKLSDFNTLLVLIIFCAKNQLICENHKPKLTLTLLSFMILSKHFIINTLNSGQMHATRFLRIINGAVLALAAKQMVCSHTCRQLSHNIHQSSMHLLWYEIQLELMEGSSCIMHYILCCRPSRGHQDHQGQ